MTFWKRASFGPKPFLLLAGLIGAGLLSPAARSVRPEFGDPLPGLDQAQRALFAEGKEEFEGEEDASDGLGPTFNDVSCRSCHSIGGTGGGSERVVTRYGRITNGRFDPMSEWGGTLIHEKGIGVQGSCDFKGETVPETATIVAHRRTTPLFGLGLVDAVPDEAFRQIAALEALLAPRQAGRVSVVDNLVTGRKSVGKFGWKAQVPSLKQFAADAYLNEMGITSPIFPDEHCPQGDCGLLVCDPRKDDPEDAGGVDTQKFTDFMTFLGAPPPGPFANGPGAHLFEAAGCATCHTASLRTAPNRVAALDRKTFFPYSDFLLHDMGKLGDGIEQGDARQRELKTAPRWGNRLLTTFLHDGSASTLTDAIRAHDGQGRESREAFDRLRPNQKEQLLAFVKSL
ncbi:MAG: di-heme oxidoredictase family protein [Thermoanaerobaculia bacterium]